MLDVKTFDGQVEYCYYKQSTPQGIISAGVSS